MPKIKGWSVASGSPEQTMKLGEELGRLLRSGDILCLTGDLGAGKTHFAKGVALGMGIDESITSPTFTLINEYQGCLPLYHMDVYRLDGPGDMNDLGYEEYFYGSGVTLLEWADRVRDILPGERLDIEIAAAGGDDHRILSFLPRGDRYVDLVEEMISVAGSGD